MFALQAGICRLILDLKYCLTIWEVRMQLAGN